MDGNTYGDPSYFYGVMFKYMKNLPENFEDYLIQYSEEALKTYKGR